MSSAFDLLTDIEQNIVQQGAELPEQVGSGTWQAVAVEQSGALILLDMAKIREVLPLPECTRLPGVKNWVAGIANVRGQILPVIDLGSFLEQAPSRSHPSHRVLVVRSDEAELGFIVDRVFGMKQVTEGSESSESIATTLPEFIAPYCNGVQDVESETFGLFSVDKLLHSVPFKQIVVV